MEILSSILKERSSNYLLGIYTTASTVILALCGSLVSRMLYEEVEMEVKIIMYPDIIMKNILILGGCLLIIFYLVHREEAVREKQKLNRELETEKEFRENFHSNSLLTYCANITKDRFVKEKSEFILPEVGGYRESLVENRAQHPGTLGRRTYTSQAGDIRVSVSFSIGVTISHSGNNTTYEQLYERADRMLYQAKENGRDGYVIERVDKEEG